MQGDGVLDLKTFVPARDYALSKQFYADLGFTLNWDNKQVAEFQVGNFRFLLQDYFQQQWAENFMLQLMVSDTKHWWQHITDARLVEKYPGITAKPPTVQPWGLRVLYLSDPSGVLWHIADHAKA